MQYKLVVETDKGNPVTSFILEQATSKKGTYATVTGKPGNAALPFGKLYIDESKLTDANGKQVKAGNKPRKAKTSKAS